jgi:hypothetical protein
MLTVSLTPERLRVYPVIDGEVGMCSKELGSLDIGL